MALRTVLASAVAGCLLTCAASGSGQSSPGNDRTTWSGRLLLTFNETRLYLQGDSDGRDDRKSCVDISPLDDTLREQMERIQNARVRIRNAAPGEDWHCSRGISVSSIANIENLSAPEPFEQQEFSGYLPEERIPHADDIRGFAVEVIRTIARADYEAFRRQQLLDPVTESILERTHNDFARRRFNFIAQHKAEFFGVALSAAAPQVIVRRLDGRNGTSACICRRSTKCKDSEGFDAPRLGSWGDAMFCFKVYYDGEDESDNYRPQDWRVADPIFG